MSEDPEFGDDDAAEAMRLAGRQWLQMLARAGVSQLGSGDAESAVGQYFESVGDAAAPPPGSETPTAGATPGALAGQDTSSPPATSPPVSENQPSDLGARKTAPARRIIAGAGTNPALKRSGDAVDDGPNLDTFPDLSDAERTSQLSVLDNQVKGCTRCPQLAEYRTQTVFGVGNIRPRLIMMGEAPGADEDRLGEPMVGVAGQLLDKIIAAMKLRREDVYILNTVKCRPPQNRNPTEEECSHCREYWRQQLEILRPECIVCLGAVASKTLLQTSSPVGRLRGKFHDYRGVPVAVTYHPAYLLRTESAKRQTWEDMKMVMERLGISL